MHHEIEHASPDACLDHCASKYSWDMRSLARALELDIYGSIRVVNYLRREVLAKRAVLDEEELIAHLKAPFRDGARPAFLDDDSLLFPVLEDDALLTALQQEPPEGDESEAATGMPETLQAENERLRNQLSLQQAMLEDAKISLAAMVEDGAHAPSEESDESPAARDAKGSAEQTLPKKHADNEKRYFDSYAKTGIHHEMLSDHTRTESYRLFLQENPSLIKDKIVLDGQFSPRAPPPRIFPTMCRSPPCGSAGAPPAHDRNPFFKSSFP